MKKNYLLEKIIEIFSKEKRDRFLYLGCSNGDYSKRSKDLGFNVIASYINDEKFKYKDKIEFKKCDITQILPFDHIDFIWVTKNGN